MKLAILIFLASLFLAPSAFADTSCQPIYGGGQTCTSGIVGIEKDVVNPSSNTDVHNMGINDPQFHSGDTITFHITITNNSSNNINQATVTDTFPQFIQMVSGPGPVNNNTLTFTMGTLSPNQSQTFTILTRVGDTSSLPSNPDCLVNQASVTTQGGQSAQDSSQFCLAQTSGVTAPPSVATPQATQSPATGSNFLLLLLLIPISALGIVLQKVAKKGEA